MGRSAAAATTQTPAASLSSTLLLMMTRTALGAPLPGGTAFELGEDRALSSPCGRAREYVHVDARLSCREFQLQA